jgi:glycerol-3-phosphate O-acyltransferase
MREYCRTKGVDFQRLAGDERRSAMAELGAALMNVVGRVVPVVPVALMATVFVRNTERALSELELKAEAARLMAALEAKGAHIYVPRRDLDYALAVGLRMLRLRNLVAERDGLYQVLTGEKALVEYYANSIAHLF